MLVVAQQRNQDTIQRNIGAGMTEKYAPACIWHIRIGNLFIAPSRNLAPGKVYIGRVDKEEGAEFDADALAPILQQFYDAKK